MKFLFSHFLITKDLKWHLITIILSATVIILLFATLFLLYKFKRLSLYSFVKISDVLKFLILALLLFRTLYLHYALIMWLIIYLVTALTERKKRTVRYINIVGKDSNKTAKLYRDIHKVNMQRCFLETIKSFLFLKGIPVFINLKQSDKSKIAWKKSFLPFKYFAIGLIVPTLNLLFIGSQYNALDIMALTLLEIYILIFTILYLLYPIAYYCAVEIETGIMFQSKIPFNICYAFFTIAIIVVFTGISINT